jgi:hypothetical protein
MAFQFEMLKFSIYILFPVGVLYLYNEQDFLDKFSPSQAKTMETFRTDPKNLFVILLLFIK